MVTLGQGPLAGLGRQQRGVVDVVDDQERGRAGLERRLDLGQGHVRALALLVAERHDLRLGQPDDLGRQVAGVRRGDQEPPAGIAEAVAPGVGERQHALADAGDAVHRRDRADLALEQVVQERVHLVAPADEVLARLGHGVGRCVPDGGALEPLGDLAGQIGQLAADVLPLERRRPLGPERQPLDVLPAPQVLDPVPELLLHRIGLERRVPDHVDRRDPLARQCLVQLGLDVDFPLLEAVGAAEVAGREDGHHHLRLLQAGEDPRLPRVHRPDLVGIEEDPQRRARDSQVIGLDRLVQRRDLARMHAAVIGVGVADEQVELVPFRGFHHGGEPHSIRSRRASHSRFIVALTRRPSWVRSAWISASLSQRLSASDSTFEHASRPSSTPNSSMI